MRGGTAQWPIVDVLAARKFNQASGGALIAPWQIADIPDEWLEAVAAINSLPAMQTGIGEIEARKARIRSEHPTYRKTKH